MPEQARERDTTILIVEDNPTQSKQLERILERNGYAVRVARGGAEGLEAMRKERPSVVISDVLMPGMDGFQFCHTVKSDPALKRIPVMLLTVLSDPQDIIKGLEAGADNFLTKPYDAEMLLARVDYILANQKLRNDGRTAFGMDVLFMGQKHHITADQMQIVDLLIGTYETVVQKTIELQKANERLQEALDHIKTLRGLIPICSGCKKIRDDRGYWQHLEIYLKQHSDAEFTHSLCPHCMREHYPQYYDQVQGKAGDEEAESDGDEHDKPDEPDPSG